MPCMRGRAQSDKEQNPLRMEYLVRLYLYSMPILDRSKKTGSGKVRVHFETALDFIFRKSDLSYISIYRQFRREHNSWVVVIPIRLY